MNPFLGKRAITRSADFERIKNLPRRAVQDVETLVREMTLALREPGGTMWLRPLQAMALYELMTEGGLFAPLPVGTGKTLLCFLAPVVLGVTRSIGLVPASLLDKSEKEREQLSRHWKIDRSLHLCSYESLGRVAASTFLDNKVPELIVADEVHRLKNPKAACTRRVMRYFREHPETRFVAMSGTVIKNSLLNFAPLLRKCLGASKAPIPQSEGELSDWADCLDERVNPLNRVRPGVLPELAPDVQGDDDLSRARRAFHNRLVSTPGVICAAGSEQVTCSIYIRGQKYEVNETTGANFKTLRELWETPDGWALSEAVDVWRHARELAVGLHYVWNPRPPDEWLSARRAWAAFVRETISNGQTYDSELQVANACIDGQLPDDEFRAWQEIRPSFVVNQEAIWHDDSVLKICEAWLEKGAGICWVGHTFFGRELARRTGLPYFGQSGEDADGNSLVDMALKIDRGEAKAGPIIASIAANGTGKNLQAWSRNLVVSCPTGADVWEQLVGRTHRPGQTADEVTVDLLVGCVEHTDAWARAQGEARMAGDMLGTPQKILLADTTMPDTSKEFGSRWQKVTNTSKGAT